MKKILVTTDFSAASKAGLRFAIHLASQMEAELVFFHCFQALIPTTVNRDHIRHALQEQGDVLLKKLEHFVARVHKGMKAPEGFHRCVVVENLDPEATILEYATVNGFQYICMSTRGAGAIRKLMGTHTGYVLHRSTIPVLVVPENYRVRPFKKVLYASDLESLDKEMSVVSAFSRELNVKTDLVHFFFPGEISLDPATVTDMWRLKYPNLDQVVLRPYDMDKKFPAQLERVTTQTKPSIVVFFTHTHKHWFDQLFGASVSEAASFVTQVPMLVYRKLGL